MHIERIFLRTFRCFGAEIRLVTSLTAFVGSNGSGKTAVMQAFQRLFGMTDEQRRLRRRDFRVPSDEKIALTERRLELEAILAFPQLAGGNAKTAVPGFFQHMAADENWHTPGNPGGLAAFFVALSRAKQRALLLFCQALGSEAKVADLYQPRADAGVQEVCMSA